MERKGKLPGNVVETLLVNKPKTFKSEPSEMISRLQTFMPKMKQANEELMEKLNQNINVNIEDADEENHIEMNIDCGVFDVELEEEKERGKGKDPIKIAVGKNKVSKKKKASPIKIKNEELESLFPKEDKSLLIQELH